MSSVKSSFATVVPDFGAAFNFQDDWSIQQVELLFEPDKQTRAKWKKVRLFSKMNSLKSNLHAKKAADGFISSANRTGSALAAAATVAGKAADNVVAGVSTCSTRALSAVGDAVRLCAKHQAPLIACWCGQATVAVAVAGKATDGVISGVSASSTGVLSAVEDAVCARTVRHTPTHCLFLRVGRQRQQQWWWTRLPMTLL